MKTVMMILGALSAVSANAADGTLLTYTANNGTVAPKYAETFVCEINALNTSRVIYGPLRDFPFRRLKPTTYTKNIPNARVLMSLIAEASRHENVHYMDILPIGGGNERYTANYKKMKELTLLQLHGGGYKVQKNPSAAADKLLELMDVNCKVRSTEGRY